jgi:arylsulfatase A-like enzyme
MKRKPHLLLITSDQHRADCLGVAGHPVVRTPHLDGLAYQGMRFANAYSNCPVCIPARTTMITGRDAHTNGCPVYNANFRVDRHKDQMLGGLITKAGYQTQLVGKTHWHTEPRFRAGFESVYGYDMLSRLARERMLHTKRTTGLSGMGGNEFYPTLSQFPPHLNSTQWLIDRSIEFLEERDDTAPFFLWTSLTEPHPPMVIHEPYYSMYDRAHFPEPVMPDWAADESLPYPLYVQKWQLNPGPMTSEELQKTMSVYYGMITHIDHQLGRLFGTLMRLGLWEDTLVIYTSDHGEMLGDFGCFSKSIFTENAAKIPFIVKWPSWIEAQRGRTCDSLVELADILPTCCDFAEGDLPTDLTGRSLRGLIEGKSDKVREELHGQIGNSHMYHDGRYKYLYFADDGRELLFDVNEDPQDRHDLSGKEDLLEIVRNKFINHLQEEGHRHLSDGKLLNRELVKPPVSSLRSKALNSVRFAAYGISELKSD